MTTAERAAYNAGVEAVRQMALTTARPWRFETTPAVFNIKPLSLPCKVSRTVHGIFCLRRRAARTIVFPLI